MGTPCAIGMKLADGSVRAIRCNYDGYVAGAGVILAGWYTEPAKIEALLALGDLSQLAEELDTCVAYHRDRGERMRPARRFTSVDEYQHIAEAEMSADYLYVYDDGKWLIYGLYNVAEWVQVEGQERFENLVIHCSLSAPISAFLYTPPEAARRQQAEPKGSTAARRASRPPTGIQK